MSSDKRTFSLSDKNAQVADQIRERCGIEQDATVIANALHLYDCVTRSAADGSRRIVIVVEPSAEDADTETTWKVPSVQAAYDRGRENDRIFTAAVKKKWWQL